MNKSKELLNLISEAMGSTSTLSSDLEMTDSSGRKQVFKKGDTVTVSMKSSGSGVVVKVKSGKFSTELNYDSEREAYADGWSM